MCRAFESWAFFDNAAGAAEAVARRNLPRLALLDKAVYAPAGRRIGGRRAGSGAVN
jgi:hypothetical protein